MKMFTKVVGQRLHCVTGAGDASEKVSWEATAKDVQMETEPVGHDSVSLCMSRDKGMHSVGVLTGTFGKVRGGKCMKAVAKQNKFDKRRVEEEGTFRIGSMDQ
eukprot:1159721-Pelagomonas_calceolata.AAC.3